MPVITSKIRIYVEDTDAGGIVFYANYLKYMERSRSDFFRYLGYSQAAKREDGTQFVVVSATIHYRLPAMLDDVLELSLAIDDVRKASVSFKQSVLRDEKMICQATIKVAHIDSISLKPQKLPQHLHENLLELVGQNSVQNIIEELR